VANSGPHHQLDEVKKLVVAGELAVDNFHRSVQLTYDVADEYGLNIDGVGWYIKLCIDRTVPEVVVISFHPPQWPMRTQAGTIKPP
jgi:hypothetical protein